jgi:tetratricopeptide (TPR) repeat protein
MLYLKLAFWPHPLVLDYGPDVVHHIIDVLPYVLALIALLVGTAIALWRWPVVGFAGAWLFLILAPTTSIVPVVGQPMAEHRMYLSLAAVVTVVVFGLYRWIGWRSAIMLAVVAVGLGWLSVLRNGDYRSDVAICRDTVAKCPGNARAHYNLGEAWGKIPGHLPDSIFEYEASLRINPQYEIAHYNLGLALSKTPGRLLEAITEYEAALRIKPDLKQAHTNLGVILANIPGRLPEAIKHFEAALQIEPDSPEARENLRVARQTLEISQHIQHWTPSSKAVPLR